MQGNVLDISTENRRLNGVVRPALIVCALLAVIGIGGSLLVSGSTEHGTEHLLETYLVSFSFFLAISLGGLFFVLLQHCTRAGWSVVVRRVAEAVAANVWLMALLAIPVVLGMNHLYRWTDTAAAAHDPLLAGKAPVDMAPAVADTLIGPKATPAHHQRLVDSMALLHTDSYIKTVEATTYYDRRAVLPEIEAPTLLVFAAGDRLTPPPIGERMAAKIPNSRLVVIPEAGHLVNIERPQAFNDTLLEFLESQ